ncbi:Aste57867_2806 [Aphanomyces stellatus]|uniref:Kinase n=1 Tax=Aphanomyces stellatus TaxID=120398 RepID=A0A485K8E5_9STRA|nr:hypothetical protein As57867_002799 [Aphanomyces stellatus]VFT79995.1 Aste57867_2806 [Aphanomyces stellatus]
MADAPAAEAMPPSTETSASAAPTRPTVTASSSSRIVARSCVGGTAFYLFKHQVGGHKPILRSAPGEICKPAIPVELHFYQALAPTYPQLIAYVPTYLGTIVVDLQPSGSSMDDGAGGDDIPAAPRQNEGKGMKKVPSMRRASRSVDLSFSHALWNKDIQERSSFLCEYLVLGDLTQGFVRPCILDIKMGTRQHGQHASPQKVRSHSAKCKATTSASLGFRLCGMQIFQPADGRYVLRDKHWGRTLKVGDIKPALQFFLSTGDSLRIDAVKVLLTRLRALQGVIQNTTGIRFWGASLLLVYEGDPQSAVRTDMRLIDFANCHHDTSITTPDEGLLLGLHNLITYLGAIQDSSHE